MADRKKVINEFGNWCEAMADECPIICLRVRDLLEEQEEQIKTRDESLEKAREEIKWLRGMLKEQEVVKPKIDAFGLPYCPKCKTLVYNTWEFCPHCGQELKWE